MIKTERLGGISKLKFVRLTSVTRRGWVVCMTLNIEKEGSTSEYDTLEYSFMMLRGRGVGGGLAVVSLLR